MRLMFRNLCLTAISAMLLTSCTHTPESHIPASTPEVPPAYQIPKNIHYSDHWAPTPPVDLMSADGTFIRAFAEADDVRLYNNNAAKGSYPGFDHANQTSRNNIGGGSDEYGFTTRWVHDFTANPDSTATATVCSYVSINPQNDFLPFLLADVLTYHRKGQGPPANQKGPGRAPAVSVFGDWYATSYESMRDSPNPCSSDQPPIDKGADSTPGWPDGGVP